MPTPVVKLVAKTQPLLFYQDGKTFATAVPRILQQFRQRTQLSSSVPTVGTMAHNTTLFDLQEESKKRRHQSNLDHAPPHTNNNKPPGTNPVHPQYTRNAMHPQYTRNAPAIHPQ
jgi:hypothetical protein